MKRSAAIAASLLLSACPADWLAMGPEEASTSLDILEVTDLERVLHGLDSPTDLAVDDEGTLYALDGRLGRVHVVPSDGQPERVLEVEGQPVGLTWHEGRLWLPHSDAPVLEALEPDTGASERFALPVPPERLRLTDVVASDLGLLVLSNDGGPWWFDPAIGIWAPLMHDLPLETPFLGAAVGDEAIAVVDVNQDRALLFEPAAPDYLELGKWGVWEGTFIHPTGIAADKQTRIFIADGLLGVVQVFDDRGRFLGSLGRDGKPWRLEHPMGVATWGDTLWVADAGQGSVYAVTVDDRTDPLSGWRMYERKVPRMSLLTGRTTTLSRVEEACRDCHDGSVQPPTTVWNRALRQHPVNIAPEKDIPQPFILDEDGELYCGTCHIPHRMQGLELDSGDLEVFLREPRARSELCLSCHPDVIAEVRGLDTSDTDTPPGHPLGPVPEDVSRIGASAISPDTERVECLDCHGPHGAVGEMLLASDEAAMGGCQRCHEGVGPEHVEHTHPVGEALEDATVTAALQARGVFLGQDGQVTCLTCHDIHASPEQSGLTISLENHERCILCHDEQAKLRGGPHDLRDGPQGHVATACLGCHELHEAQAPSLMRQAGSERDPTGCLACHRRGGEADTKIDPDQGHPLFEDNPAPSRVPSVNAEGSMVLGAAGQTACLSCHDPHARSDDDNLAMLRTPGPDAGGCLDCHDELRPVLGSDHDLRLTDSRWSTKRSEAMKRGGFCLACHGLHDGDGWRGLVTPTGGTPGLSPTSSACLGCHQRGNAAEGTVVEVWDHPEDLLLTTAKLPWDNTGELPLYDLAGNPTDDQQIGIITCLTCHDPHVWSPKQGGESGGGEGDTRTSFLRDGWEGFCSGCHGEEALQVYRYFHDPDQREQIREKHQRRDWNLYQEGGE